jgi:hypothetical protein
MKDDSLRTKIETVFASEWETVGFAKRRKHLHTKGITDDINVVVMYRVTSRTRQFEVDVSVGIRSTRIERLVSELFDWRYDKYLPATIFTPIGYILPENRFLGWPYESEEDLRTASADIGYMIEHLLHFAQRNDSLDRMCATLAANTYGWTYSNLCRHPVALWLLGLPNEAHKALVKFRDSVGSRTDDEAINTRIFCDHLERKITSDESK